MSRAGDILNWVSAVDEVSAPTSHTEDPKKMHNLNKATGYHYQGREPQDSSEIGQDTRDLDGSKPAGMMASDPSTRTARRKRRMSGEDMDMMDTEMAKH